MAVTNMQGPSRLTAVLSRSSPMISSRRPFTSTAVSRKSGIKKVAAPQEAGVNVKAVDIHRSNIFPSYNSIRLNEERMEEIYTRLPYPADVHETITRAWLLHGRKVREAQQADLARKKARMREACDALQIESPRHYVRAVERVPLYNQHPEDMDKLQKLRLLPHQTPKLAPGQARMSVAERVRRIRTALGGRIIGLVPRELRAPTWTPPTKAWPAYKAITPDEK